MYQAMYQAIQTKYFRTSERARLTRQGDMRRRIDLTLNWDYRLKSVSQTIAQLPSPSPTSSAGPGRWIGGGIALELRLRQRQHRRTRRLRGR